MTTATETAPVYFAAPEPYFICVYEVDRVYGGPEEGGWWYDTRTFVYRDPRPFFPKGDWPIYEFEAEYEAFKAEHPEWVGDNGYRYSMAPNGCDYAIGFYQDPQPFYPTERPHYE